MPSHLDGWTTRRAGMQTTVRSALAMRCRPREHVDELIACRHFWVQKRHRVVQ